MTLDDFLKVKQVRCVSKNAEDNLTIGKKYKVTHIIFGLQSDKNSKGFYDFDSFEPVIEPTENPLQGVELTPEFEAVEPKFKVGDKVYCILLEPKIFTILSVESDNTAHFGEIGEYGYRWWRFKNLCHATPENYERLQATFPDIEFEQPPKELMGSDLCFKKLKSGKKLVICAVSDLSDEKAIKRLQDGDNCIRIIKDCDPAPYDFIDTHGIRHGFAVPLNDETGEPLTEAVLDE